MATIATTLCDGCGKKIHSDPGERKFRIDLLSPEEVRGFDVCETCFRKARKLVGG